MISCVNQNCNTLNPPTAKFCMQCGTKIVIPSLSVNPSSAFGDDFTLNPLTASSKNFIENLGGGVQLEMIAIPGGTFEMGDYDGNASEKPPHQVNIKPFYLGKYVFTQEQYQAVKGTNPSRFQGAKRPVEQVNWNQTMEFCKKLSQKTGRNYRLPSEAEWEYACRAGTQTKYYFGDDEKQLGNYAWYDGNSNWETHPVGEKEPNQFGLYDMHGNVWEWCSDRWHENYHNTLTDGSSWETGTGDNRVRRGGSWSLNAVLCRSTFRLRYSAGFYLRNLGFRVALDFPLPSLSGELPS
jgi:formylglycine-generating enzyme required for sulfatase activity